MKQLKTCLQALMIVLAATSVCSCSDDDDIVEPTFSGITVTPEQAVYHVGDVITLTIHRTSTGSDNLTGETYWWYASWWFSDPDMKADFQEFTTDGTCTSSEITLTEPGEVTLYFFGQARYPKWDYRKIEISKIITVIE